MLRVFTTVILLPSVASTGELQWHSGTPMFPCSRCSRSPCQSGRVRAYSFKYTQKPSAMQARLQLPRRSRINGAIAANIRRSRAQSKCICSPDFGSPGSAGSFTPSSTGHAPRIRGNNPPGDTAAIPRFAKINRNYRSVM